MFNYEKHFNQYCKDNKLDLILSFNMPAGYETANGTFDVESKTVFINADYLKESPDYEKAFYLFHELRHSSQYLCPNKFSIVINRSIQYIIMYDGTCYKIINGKYYECKLKGGAGYFTNIYLGQLYEVDANKYAYEQVKKIYGDSNDLRKLYESWMPSQTVSDDVYDSLYALIDKKIQMTD
ncbi:MAG: hypothetical protein K5765_00905 [Clostridia bacterium]|nr:hypothetical protein [Clostridia bacterium]